MALKELSPEMKRLLTPKQRKELGHVTPEEIAARVEVKLERELQKHCNSLLTRHNIKFLHLSHRAREKKGWPDLTFVLPGSRPIAVELKTKDGRLRPEQKEMLAGMAADGWETYVIRDYDSFRKLVDLPF